MLTTRFFLLPALVCLTGFVVSPARAAAASAPAGYQDRGPVQRVLTGKVADKSGAGIKGAIVYVKDGRTNAIRSAVSDESGSYRFVQLQQNTDYEVWAKVGDKRSKSKNVSSFDTKNDLSFTLVIDQ